MADLTLNIVTPKASYGPFSCDSIHLTVSDNLKGNGGGSCGIRKGHAKSLLSLGEGRIEALHAGEKILVGNAGKGFATIEKNVVNVVVECFENELEKQLQV